MHRFRSWTLDPPEWRTQRNRLLPIEGGDGSTLSLDFTSGVLDPRLQFTRGTNATFINSQGLVEWAGANIVLQSGDLSQNGTGQWTARTNLTVSGWTGFDDPFGGSTAVKIIPNTTNGLHYVGTADISMAVGIPFTVSVYVKASGYSIVGLVTTNSNSRAHFNLSNQTSAGYGVTNTRTITDVGNGWYRITMSFTVANGPLVAFWVTAMNTATDPAANSFAGASGSSDGILAWGAQINPGTSAQPYYGTTTTTYQAPRFDYDPTTLQPRGLLIEGTSSNLVYYSQGMATSGPPGWSGVNITRTANTGGTAPDGSSNTATKFRSTAAIGTSTEYIHTLLTGLTNGATYTFSMWAKADGAEWIWVSLRYFGVDNGSFFQLTGDGVLGNTTGTLAGKSIVKYPNGWYRISISHVLTGATVAYPFFIPCTSNGTGYASITGQTPNGVLCWGGQVELGFGASSYIPTGASTGNRNLDSCYIAGTNFTSWFSTGAGTVVAQSDNVCLPTSSSQNLVGNFSNSTSSNYIRMGYRVGGGTTELLLTSVGSSIQGSPDSGFTPTLNTPYKTAYAWDTNNFACCANGGSVGTDASGSVAGAGVITSLTIGGDFYQTSGPNSIYMKNGHIRSFKYWPTRLANAQLQALTT